MNRKKFSDLAKRLLLTAAFFTLSGAAISALSGCTARAISGTKPPTSKAPAERVVSGKVVREIVGKWQKKQTGGSFAEYARYAENTGVFETLEIASDGSVRRETLTAAKIYDCPVEEATTSEGAIIVESATHLNITLDAGTMRHTENCSPEKNYTAAIKPTTTDYQWKIIESEDGIAELCLTNSDTFCYRRIE